VTAENVRQLSGSFIWARMSAMSAAADACRYLSQCPLQSNWRPGPVRQQAAHKRSAWFGHQLPASKAPWFRSLKSLCRVPESGQARSRATPVSDCRAPALAGHENFGEIMGVSSRRPQVGIGRRAKICRAADGKRTHGKRMHGRAGSYPSNSRVPCEALLGRPQQKCPIRHPEATGNWPPSTCSHGDRLR